MNVQAPQWVWLFFPVLFVVVWVFVSRVISLVGGWHELSAHYLRDFKPQGRAFRFQSASLRYGTSYNNCLNFVVNGRGLGMSVPFLFRAGHPPLFIPWHDITVSHEKQAMFKIVKFNSVRLRFRKTPGVSLLVSEALAERMKKAAGGGWMESGPGGVF